jgi:tetratricopeptide (TPR) repeat protein
VTLSVRDGKMDRKVTIPAASITRIYYYTPDVLRTEYNGGFVLEGNWERSGGSKKTKDELLTKVFAKYAETEQKLGGRPEARRYLRFRIAMLHARVAKDDPSKADDAIKKLTDFTAANRGGVTIVPALTTQAKLLEEAGRTDEARSAYETLASLEGVPPALVRQSQLFVGKLSLRAGKWADAQKQLEKLAKGLSGADPEKPFVEAFLAESRIGQGNLDGVDAALKDVMKGNEDGKLRGLVHNVLGEWHEKKGQPEDAFWHYLRVDALYPDDPEEHARALFRLAELFDKVKKDPIRGREYAQRLLGPTFDGTRYQKLGKAAGLKPEEKEKDG